MPGDQWVDPITGEMGIVRHDPSAGWYTTGAKEVVRGTLWANCHVRSEHENERVNVGFARVPRGRGDASVFMDLVEAVRPDFPPALGYVYDMAMDGETINRGYRMGLIPVTKVSLDNKGMPSSSAVCTATVIGKDGRARDLQIWAYNGAYGIEVVTATTSLFVRLDLVQIKFATNSDGTQRAYTRLEFPSDAPVPEALRGARVMPRLDQCDEDLKRTIKGRPYNRAICVRPHPEGSEGFEAVYGVREDAESFNNLLKQSLWNKRSHSLDPDRQFLDMLAFNLNRNIRALMAYEARTGVNLFSEMEHGRKSLAEVTDSLSRALAI